MRNKFSDLMEKARLHDGYFASAPGDRHGMFMITAPWGGQMLIMSSGNGPDAEGWEHVSVSFDKRAPSWREMCWVKAQFWRDDECVVQFHPAGADYVNVHPHCLHLWRHVDGHPTPPKWMLA